MTLRSVIKEETQRLNSERKAIKEKLVEARAALDRLVFEREQLDLDIAEAQSWLEANPEKATNPETPAP